MKMTCRIAVLLAVAALVAPSAGAAQSSPSAIAAGLAREQMEDNIKALLTDMEDLKRTTLALDRRVAALEAENRQLREEIKAAGNHSVSPDALKRLSEQIQEVDKRRLDDNKRVAETLKEFGKEIARQPVAAPPSHPGRNGGEREAGSPGRNRSNTNYSASNALPGTAEQGFEYVVQPNDVLDKIVKYYRDENIKVTRKMIMDANPGVNWDRLKINQKIFVPKPKTP